MESMKMLKSPFATLAATGLAALSLALAPAAQAKADAKPNPEGEKKLAKLLEGRVAGKPVNCIPYSRLNDTTVVKKTAIVYRVGRTLYVNRPTNADLLDDDDILVTRLWGSQLCSVDTVQLRDRMTPNMWNGFVGLRQFVPYTKPKTSK